MNDKIPIFPLPLVLLPGEKLPLHIFEAKYKKMVELGLNHIKNNYSFEKYETSWVKLMDEIVEKNGSWENRKNHDRWYLLEVA